jgi:type IV pilus secretin PilQ/predicted competence protein
MIKRNVSYLVWGVALMMLLAVGATSEPVRINGASIGARGNAEILRIHLDRAHAAGETPVYQDHLFHQAGYGYIEFPGAVLAGGERVLKHDGVFLEGVRLKREEGSPSPSVRVYFYFKKLASYTIEQEASEIRVVFAEKPERHSAIPPDADMYFSISSPANPSSSPAPAPDSLDRAVDVVEVKSKPLILAQLKQTETQVSAPSFFVPPTNKETAPKPSNAVLPEEDIFAQLVTLRFKDADLQNVIRMIAQKTGLNIIMSRTQVTGTITLDLEDVPLGSALDAILKTNDLAFVREPGGIVRIVPRKEIRVSALELRTVHIPVNWVPATRLADTLKPFLSKAEGSQIQADGDSNALLITDTPPSVETLLALVEKLDIPEKQVMIEMRLVDIGKDLLRAIGMNWSLSESQKYTTGGVPKYDVPDSFNSATGAAYGLGSNLTWGRMVSIFGQDFDFDSFVNANQNKTLVRVLANPRVITLNNVVAKIEIINEKPYINSVIGSGGAVTTVAEFKESGITMEVTPYVTNNGYVRMKIKPEQKIYRGRDPYAQMVPIIDRRIAETNVIIRDEETVLLGGLRQDETNDVNTGTPWFMEIPVVGWFFKRNTTENIKLETVMFVTPHIIKEPALSELEKTQYEQIDYGWDLPAEFFKGKKEMPAAKK